MLSLCPPLHTSSNKTSTLKACPAGGRMVSVSQKSRSCVLLLLSLTPSIFPSQPISLLPALTISVWPALSLSALTDTSTSPVIPKPPSSTTDPTSLVKPPFMNLFSTKPASVTFTTSSRDLLISLTSATPTALYPLFGRETSLSSDPLRCHYVFQRPLKTLKNISPNTSKMLPQVVKRLRSSLKTLGPQLHKNLLCSSSKMEKEHPVAPGKPSIQTTRLAPSSISTSLPNLSSPPENASHKPISPVPTPSFSTLSPATTSQTPTTRSSKTSGTLPPPSLPHTASPLFEHHPFIVSWNIPDLVCNRHNISLDTSPFKGVATPAKVPGQFLSLFYTDRLGLYPHVDLTSRKQFNGGIPQRGNLRASMNKARADISYYIPSTTRRGLAVIDWEEWRPLWDRNWGTKKIYQTLSVAHVMHTNSSLTVEQATEKAKQQFQKAARSLMSAVLAMGRAMRPNYLWGFYLFPNCYNYGWERHDYTGQCSAEVKRQNDELFWLWESSTALYPSVYLQASLADNPKAALMVRNRVQEALRVSALPKRLGAAPVFVYTRPVFVDQNRRFLNQADLVSTIGESAAVGASGAVLWGASADYDDQSSCEALASYLSSTMNPYITNVTIAAQLCSNFLCRGNGRCVRKNYNSSHYLHLNPESFRILHVQKRYLVLGRPTVTDLKTLGRKFTCQCYKGLNCSPRTDRELTKALKFSLKQGLHQKAHTLNKAMFDDLQQASIAKDNGRKHLKV